MRKQYRFKLNHKLKAGALSTCWSISLNICWSIALGLLIGLSPSFSTAEPTYIQELNLLNFKTFYVCKFSGIVLDSSKNKVEAQRSIFIKTNQPDPFNASPARSELIATVKAARSLNGDLDKDRHFLIHNKITYRKGLISTLTPAPTLPPTLKGTPERASYSFKGPEGDVLLEIQDVDLDTGLSFNELFFKRRARLVTMGQSYPFKIGGNELRANGGPFLIGYCEIK